MLHLAQLIWIHNSPLIFNSQTGVLKIDVNIYDISSGKTTKVANNERLINLILIPDTNTIRDSESDRNDRKENL